MAQPKNPPVSLRLPEEVLSAIDEMAARRKITRHKAMVSALIQGLAADHSREALERVLAAAPETKAAAPTGTAIMARKRDERSKFTSRLKGEWKAP